MQNQVICSKKLKDALVFLFVAIAFLRVGEYIIQGKDSFLMDLDSNFVVHKAKICQAGYYGWRNGAKFTKFIFLHIHGCYCDSRIYLFTFNN